MLRLWWLPLLAGLAACGSNDSSASTGACRTGCPKPIACPNGFAARADSAGCDPILPEADCPAGTFPQVGSTSCVDVGWTSCPAGFVPDPSGWGCRDVIPAKACTGATIETIGQPDCRSIGDCAAAFPPSAATIFVNASYAASQLDATHFATISGALAAAPAGATIAVEAGVYTETLAPAHDVTIVGRCAESVIVASPDGGGVGLDVWGVDSVAVRGLSFRGHGEGIVVEAGSFTLDDAIVDDSHGPNIYVTGPTAHAKLTRVAARGSTSGAQDAATGIDVRDGAHADISESAIADNAYMGLFIGSGASVSVSRSVVRDTYPDSGGATPGSFGNGIYAFEGASLSLSESVIVDNHSAGVAVAKTSSTNGTPSTATIERSAIRATHQNGHGKYGRGVEVSGGATADITDCLLAENEDSGVIAALDATAHVTGSVVLGAAPPPDGGDVIGLEATDGSHLEASKTALVGNVGVAVISQLGSTTVLTDSVVRDPVPTSVSPAMWADEYGIGMAAVATGQLELHGSAVVGANALGILVDGDGTTTHLSSSIILHTLPEPGGERAGRGIGVQHAAQLVVDGSAIVDQHVVGIYADTADAAIADSVIAAIQPNSQGIHGHGLLGIGGAHLTLEGSTVHDASAIALVLSGSSAFVSKSWIVANKIGIVAQDGSSLSEGSEAPTDPLGVVVSADTKFIDNEQRVGSGSVPLPEPIAPAGP